MMRKILLGLVVAGVGVMVMALGAREAAGAVRGVHASSAGVALMGAVRPETWTMVGQRVRNEGDEAAEVLTATSFKDMPFVQFAEPVWLPAHSVRRVWLPVRSGALAAEAKSFDIESLLLDQTGASEIEIESLNKQRETGPLPATHLPILTGILDPGEVDPMKVLPLMYKVQSVKCIADYLRSDSMPVVSAALSGFDSIVITSTPDLEMGQIAALREWVVGGGKLWVMADGVDDRFMRLVLGEDWNVQTIDRTELESFVIERGGGRKETIVPASAVAMVHVAAPGMETLCTVNGYPAALRKRIGHGQILVTTLGVDGWLSGERTASVAISDMATWFVMPREVVGVSGALRRQTIERQIGRPTLGRGPVLGVLGGLCVALLAAGVVSRVAKRAEYGALAGIVLAVGATGALIVMGGAKQNSVPLTVAGLQVADVVPEQGLITSTGSVGVYSPTLVQDPISSGHGVLWPEFEGGGGQLARMVWTDRQQWEWQHVRLRAGAMWLADVGATTSPKRMPEVRGTFGPGGFVGRLDRGDFADLADTVVVAPAGRYGLGGASGEAFSVGDESELPAGQFLQADVLTDRQRERQEVYGALSASRRGGEAFLMGWTGLWNSGIEIPASFRRAEASVMRIPVRIERPGHGVVTVPAGFMPFAVVRSPMRESMPIYTPKGEWIGDLNLAGKFFVRFDLPGAVAGMEVKSMHLRLRIVAPGREVEVVNGQGTGEPRRMFVRQGPQDLIDVTLADKFVVQPDAGGHIMLGVKVGPAVEPTAKWSMQDIKLSVTGEMP